MKAIKNLMAALMFVFMICIPITASAATCTCGKGRPHDSSHNMEWVDNGDGTHSKICNSCIMNGHTADCAQVIIETQKHNFTVEGSGSEKQNVCYDCGLREDAPECAHKNLSWSSDGEKCKQYCTDCNEVVKTTTHNYKCTMVNIDICEGTCTQCGDYFSGEHSIKKTHTPYKVKGNPTAKTSTIVWPCREHKTTCVCEYCGYSYQEKITTEDTSVDHIWKNNKCTLCGLKREILSVSGLSAKQSGRMSSSTRKTSAHWVWTGNTLKYYPAGTFSVYNYKLNAKWKKNKKAYGYVISVGKIKKGDYLHETGTSKTNYIFTKKTSYNYKLESLKKVGTVTLYVAPVSKYGFIGKAKKIKVKVS